MWIYFVLIGVISLLCISFLCLFFVSGFRSINVGSDTNEYFDMFNLVSSTEWNDIPSLFNQMEFGWAYFNKVLSCIWNDPQILLIATSFITQGCMLFFIGKNSKNPAFSVLLYILLYFF